MKKVFILRGFKLGTTAADIDYLDVKQAVGAKGYEVVPFPVTWNNKTMSQYSNSFIDFYLSNKGTENIIVGVSYGAMAALVSASHTRPNLLILCSLSGYFKEDLEKYSKDNRMIARMGKRRCADLETISAELMAQNTATAGIESMMLYGEKEKQLHPILYNRILQTAKILQPTKMIEVPNSGHNIHNPSYLAALSQSI